MHVCACVCLHVRLCMCAYVYEREGGRRAGGMFIESTIMKLEKFSFQPHKKFCRHLCAIFISMKKSPLKSIFASIHSEILSQ